jgi:hypothetical protein
VIGGHGSHPLGWTVLALVVVAYAHVILEHATAGLALAIALGILGGPARAALVDRLAHCQGRLGRRGRDVVTGERSTSGSARGRQASQRQPADGA